MPGAPRTPKAPDPKGTGEKEGRGGVRMANCPPFPLCWCLEGPPPPPPLPTPPGLAPTPQRTPPYRAEGPIPPRGRWDLGGVSAPHGAGSKAGGWGGVGGGPIRVTPPAQCAAQGGTLPAQREGGGREPFCAPPPARAPLIPPRSPPIRAPPPVTLWGGRGGVWGCEGGGVVGWGSRCEHCLSQGGFPERLQVVLELEGTRLEVELEQNW